MSQIEILIFDVDHGFCAAVQDSENNLLIIDCGRKPNFSPIKYLADYNGIPLSDLNVGLFVLSHPHGDHIKDVENLKKSCVRNRLRIPFDRFTSEELALGNTEEGIANLKQFDDAYSHFTTEGYVPPNWDFSLNYSHGLWPETARTLANAVLLNNTSYVIILTYANTKIIFPGDIQSDGMRKLLEDEQFVRDADNPTIMIAPHHGHQSSYCPDLYDSIGKPYIHICSLAKNDPYIAKQYSSDAASVGAELRGQNRWMLSTRSDGTINITITQDSCSINWFDLEDNDL